MKTYARPTQRPGWFYRLTTLSGSVGYLGPLSVYKGPGDIGAHNPPYSTQRPTVGWDVALWVDGGNDVDEVNQVGRNTQVFAGDVVISGSLSILNSNCNEWSSNNAGPAGGLRFNTKLAKYAAGEISPGWRTNDLQYFLDDKINQDAYGKLPSAATALINLIDASGAQQLSIDPDGNSPAFIALPSLSDTGQLSKTDNLPITSWSSGSMLRYKKIDPSPNSVHIYTPLPLKDAQRGTQIDVISGSGYVSDNDPDTLENEYPSSYVLKAQGDEVTFVAWGGAWHVIGGGNEISSTRYAPGDSGAGKKATLFSRGGVSGGRYADDSFDYRHSNRSYISGSMTIGYWDGTDQDHPTLTDTANYEKAFSCAALLDEELFFTAGTGEGEGEGELLSFNQFTGRFTDWLTLAGTKNDGPGPSSISARNASDILALKNWFNGQQLAVVHANAFFLLSLGSDSIWPVPSYNYTYKYSVVAGTFQDARLCYSPIGQSSKDKMGQIFLFAPVLKSILGFDGNKNSPGTVLLDFTGRQFDTPLCGCVDNEGYLWVAVAQRHIENATTCRLEKYRISSWTNELVPSPVVTIKFPNIIDLVFDGKHVWVLDALSAPKIEGPSAPQGTVWKVDPRAGCIVGKVTSTPAGGSFIDFKNAGYNNVSGARQYLRLAFDGQYLWVNSAVNPLYSENWYQGNTYMIDPDSCTIVSQPGLGTTTGAIVPVSPGTAIVSHGQSGTFATIDLEVTSPEPSLSISGISWMDQPLPVRFGGGTSNEYVLNLTAGYSEINGVNALTYLPIGACRLWHPIRAAWHSKRYSFPGGGATRTVYADRGRSDKIRAYLRGCMWADNNVGGGGPGNVAVKLIDTNGAVGSPGATIYRSSVVDTTITAPGFFEVELPSVTAWLADQGPSVEFLDVLAGAWNPAAPAAGAGFVLKLELVLRWL
jgi:hypothetical protein